MSRPGYLLNLGLTPYREAWDLQRSIAAAVSQDAIPDTVIMLEHPPVVTLGRRTDEEELHVPDGADGGGRRDRSRRQVDLPRARPARLLPDPRPQPPRARRQALLPRPRGVRHPHRRGLRRRSDEDRRPHRRLARAPAAEALLDRRPHLALGDHARLRAERRPRPRSVHGLDHRVRARGRGLHDARPRARARGDAWTRCGRTRPLPSRRSSISSCRSYRRKTARASGPSPSTPRFRPARGPGASRPCRPCPRR